MHTDMHAHAHKHTSNIHAYDCIRTGILPGVPKAPPPGREGEGSPVGDADFYVPPPLYSIWVVYSDNAAGTKSDWFGLIQ